MRELEVIRRRPKTARRSAPLLFVHGAYSGAWCWDEFFLPYFASCGYDCHAVSLRGHGGSAGGDALDQAGLDDYVADVRVAARTLDALPFVIGHSMGAVVAQRYAAAHEAAGLVLIASVPLRMCSFVGNGSTEAFRWPSSAGSRMACSDRTRCA